MENVCAKQTVVSDVPIVRQEVIPDTALQYFEKIKLCEWKTTIWDKNKKCNFQYWFKLRLTPDGKVDVKKEKDEEYKNAGSYKRTTTGFDINWTYRVIDESISVTSYKMKQLNEYIFASGEGKSILVFNPYTIL